MPPSHSEPEMSALTRANNPAPAPNPSHVYPTTSGIRPLLVASGCMALNMKQGCRSTPELVIWLVAGVGFEPT